MPDPVTPTPTPAPAGPPMAVSTIGPRTTPLPQTIRPPRSFPYVGHIDPVIQRAITARGTEFPRTTRAVWMRMVSGAGAGKVIMGGELTGNPFGGSLTSPRSFDTTYSTERALRPMAGVTSISVEPKSRDLGAIRKVTVKWMCWTLDELHRLAPFFMNPGMSVMVEFGWSTPESVRQMFPLVPAEIAKLRQPGGQDILRGKINASNGSYDVVLGLTTNFGWSMTTDGGFECTTEIMSPGEVMLGVNLDYETTENGTTNTSGDENTETLTIRKFFTEKIRDYLDGKEEVTSMIGYPNFAVEQYKSNALLFETCEMITWDHFEFIVNRFAALNGATSTISKLDSSRSLLKKHPFLRSNAFIDCVIPNPRVGSLPTLPDTRFEVEQPDGTRNFRLGGLWINLTLIEEAFTETTNLEKAIDFILGRIELAAHGFWKFKIMPDEQSGEIRIIDKNVSGTPVKNMLGLGLFVLKTYGPDSVIRNITMDSDISNETMITILYSKSDTNTTKNNTTDVQAVIFDYNVKDSIGEIVAAKPPVVPVVDPDAAEIPSFSESYATGGLSAVAMNAWDRAKAAIRSGAESLISAGQDLVGTDSSGDGIEDVEDAVSETAQTVSDGASDLLANIALFLQSNSELIPYVATKLDIRNLGSVSPQVVGSAPANADIITNVKFDIELDGISGITIGDCLGITNVLRNTVDVVYFRLWAFSMILQKMTGLPQ